MRHADFDEIEEYACTREQVEAARAADAAPKPEWQDRFPRAGESAQGTENHKLKLGILGSGSKGNCSIIAGPAGAIMVDCGFPKRTTLTRMKRLGIDPADGVGMPLTCAAHEQYFTGRDEEIPFYERKEAEAFDFGYALTTHKAQGSQWGSVLVLDESGVFKENADRWLYTAVTRAAERVTVVKL